MIYTAKDRTPYTYVIKNKITGKKYYGCRYAKKCHPSDLWKTYFTSSKIIKKLIVEFGKDCWEYEIRQVFDDIIDCKIWETRVLKKLKIPKNQNWYNQSIGGKTFILQGEALENQKRIVSEKMKWMNKQPEYIEFKKEIQKRRWQKENSKKHQSEKIKEYWNDPIWVEKIKQNRKNRLSNTEERSKMSSRMLEVWQRPDYVEKHKASMAIVRSTPSWIENNSKKQKESWQDPVKRENRLKNRKPHTDERRANQSKMTSEQNKQSWLNPETRAKRIEGIKAAKAKKKAAEAAFFHQSTELEHTVLIPTNISTAN